MARGFFSGVEVLGLTLLASLLLIVLGMVYWTITAFMISQGAAWAGLSVDGNTIVLTSGIVTAAAVIGSAIQH